MATPLSVRPNRFILVRNSSGPSSSSSSSLPRRPMVLKTEPAAAHVKSDCRRSSWLICSRRWKTVTFAGSRADDSAPFEMSLENALTLLGVSERASFDEILRAKKSIMGSGKDDQDMIAQVEAAYDMLLMQSLSQRRAGIVVSSSVRYADVKPINALRMGSMPQWLQSTTKNSLVSVDKPSTSDLGIQAGVYGALTALTYVNGTSIPSAGSYSGADVPGLILATSFGASLYFITKRNVKLGKAASITIGGLVAGAVVGSVVENWLQVDIVPFLGIHNSASVVSEFILFSQLVVSLYLR